MYDCPSNSSLLRQSPFINQGRYLLGIARPFPVQICPQLVLGRDDGNVYPLPVFYPVNSTVTSLTCNGSITGDDGKSVTIAGTDGTVFVQGTGEYTITTGSYNE